MTKKELNNKLLHASHQKDLNTVKYLLTSSELKEHANIHYKDNSGMTSLMYACSNGNLELVKYLLTSPELKEHANINHKDKSGYNVLMYTCYYRHLELVKYLLSSEELKEHANIHDKNKDGETILMYACRYGYLEISKYLIIDMNMTIDKETMNWLNGDNKYKKEIYHDVIQLIETRDLHNKLSNNIVNNKIKIIGKKI